MHNSTRCQNLLKKKEGDRKNDFLRIILGFFSGISGKSNYAEVLMAVVLF